MTHKDIEGLYDSAINFVFSQGKFSEDLLKKALQLEAPEINLLINKMISNGAITEDDADGNYSTLKTYIHSDYLSQRELSNVSDRNTKGKSKLSTSKVFVTISLMVFAVSVFIAFRQPVSLIFFFLLLVVSLNYIDKIGSEVASLLITFGSIGILFYVNSMTPLWGEMYEANSRLQEISKREFSNNVAKRNKISYAQDNVSKALKDPSSAIFSGGYISDSGAICGYVNGKNSFGAYTGNQRYAFFSGQTYVDDGSKDFTNAWDKVCK